jgi:hypothetical protein
LDKFISVSFRRTFLKLDDKASSAIDINGYKIRIFHPKSGFNLISYKNESENLLESRMQQFVTRHHLIDKFSTYSYSNDGLVKDVDTRLEEGLRVGFSDGVREDLDINRDPVQLLYLIDRHTPSPIREALVSLMYIYIFMWLFSPRACVCIHV